MALDQLLRVIQDDADAERASADRQAAATAAGIIERAREEASVVAAEGAAASEADASIEAQHELAVARLAAAGTIRAAREQAYASLVGGIRTQLAAARGIGDYPRLFHALVAESRARLPLARELRVDPRDRDLAAAVAGDLRVVAELDTAGGVELVSDDGRLVRNTFEERLANADPILRGRFADWLAATGGPEVGSVE